MMDGGILQANAEESQRCDAILMERKHKEAETEELERKIRDFQQAEREKLSTLSEDLQRKYGELQDNQKRLQADEDKLRMQFNNVCMQLGNIEEEVKADRNKQRLIEMQGQKLALQERVAKLEKEVNKPVLSEAEMREQLLDQVKKDKESAATYERNAAALEQRIKSAEEELEKLESGDTLPCARLPIINGTAFPRLAPAACASRTGPRRRRRRCVGGKV